MQPDLYASIHAAVDNASAISLRAKLLPASALPEDEQVFVLPPTYKDVGHLMTPKRDDGTHQCVLIESTQSWANRLENFLDLGAVGVAPIGIEVAGRHLTINQLPHRVFDATLRDSQQDGQAFRETPLGKLLTEAREDNATALLENAPGTLLFGAWDSHGGAKIGACKWTALMSGYIIGFDALLVQKAGVRNDPLHIAKESVKGFKSATRSEVWTIDAAKALKDDKGAPVPVDKASEVGLGNILAPLLSKGTWVSRIELSSHMVMNRLRRYSFPVDGKITPEADRAARTYLATLAVWLLYSRLMAGLDLRAGAELDAISAMFFVRAPMQPDEVLTLTVPTVNAALKQALDAATAAGFKFAGPTLFTASEKLEALVLASQGINQ